MAAASSSRIWVLPALGGEDDHAAGALADRSDQLHHAHGQVAAVAEAEAFVGTDRRQLVETDAAAEGLRGGAADALDALEARALGSVLDDAFDISAVHQAVGLDQRRTHPGVFLLGLEGLGEAA